MFPKRTSVLIAMTIYNTKKEAGTLDSKDEKNHQDHMERKPIGRQEKQKDKEDTQKYQYSYLKTAQCKNLMNSNTDEGMLLSHKILVGRQSHSKRNKSLFHH
jgi:hypothetical protein